MKACGKCKECQLWLGYRKHSSNTLLGYAARGITYEMRKQDALENARKYCLNGEKL
jgi:hypothetical protein